jgi:hypothetical protein
MMAHLSRLPFSRQEASAIAALVPVKERLVATDFQASRALATSGDLGSYRLVHFATHGFLNSEHPELSGLVLSLVGRDGRAQDGFLRLGDIYNLRLAADVVVLSACQSALGKAVRGEGLVGLTRGFMYAGAPRVVASLWQVDDESTAELMRRFYRAMLVRKLAPAAALLVTSVQTLFRGLSQTTDDPAEVLRALSKGIYDETRGSMFVTCVVGLFDLEQRTLTYANAGHPPGLIVNHSNVTLLESLGTPVGLFATCSYEAVTIPLRHGDIGILVTDGVSESIETDGICWCELARNTLAGLETPTAEQVCDKLMKMAKDGPGPTGVADWEDDQTVVVFLVDP